MKALNQLEKSGWIELERNIGSANKYIFSQRISQIED
jgi:hypothetical protein